MSCKTSDLWVNVNFAFWTGKEDRTFAHDTLFENCGHVEENKTFQTQNHKLPLQVVESNEDRDRTATVAWNHGCANYQISTVFLLNKKLE